jgi:uncharacterized protein
MLFYFKENISRWLVFRLLLFSSSAMFPKVLVFFTATFLKIFLLLILIIFLMALIRSWLPVVRIRNRLTSIPSFQANILASILGVITPFCSCSAIPVFISFLETGIPLGITFSFLIASPIVNEVILVMLAGLFGIKIAAIYLLAGLTVAVASGFIIDKLKLERYLPVWLLNFRSEKQLQPVVLTIDERIQNAFKAVKDVLSRTWIFVLAGIVIGAAIHGYIPDDLLGKISGTDSWYSLPLTVLMGIPLYACSASVAPVAFALVDKGMPLGTALAFIMAVAGLSLPEFVMLKRVLSLRLIIIFAGIVFTGILLVGYFFNWLLQLFHLPAAFFITIITLKS